MHIQPHIHTCTGKHSCVLNDRVYTHLVSLHFRKWNRGQSGSTVGRVFNPGVSRGSLSLLGVVRLQSQESALSSP